MINLGGVLVSDMVIWPALGNKKAPENSGAHGNGYGKPLPVHAPFHDDDKDVLGHAFSSVSLTLPETSGVTTKTSPQAKGCG